MAQDQKQKQNPIKFHHSQAFKEIRKNRLTKQREYFYDMLSGKFKYNVQQYNGDLLNPDLILTIDLPLQKTLPVYQIIHVQDLITTPSELMSRTFQEAKANIIKKMQQHKELNDPMNIKLRYQNAIQQYISPNSQDYPQTDQQLNDEQHQQQNLKKIKFRNDFQEYEQVVLPCVNQFNGLQDCFTLYYNAIVYTLQKDCGFKVKSFLLQNNKKKPTIYLLLFTNNQNLMRLANHYKIKKQAPYQLYDFYLNDPSTQDKRPIRFNSQMQRWNQAKTRQKSIQRYFQAKGIKRQQIIQQQQLKDKNVVSYLDYIDSMYQIMEQFKENVYELTQIQKSYIFTYNRGRINKGCQKKYILDKNRFQFLMTQEEILKQYGYNLLQMPKVYTQFFTSSDKKISFFDKLNNIMMYKPLLVGQNGQLSLFTTMQRSKLSYLILKKKLHLHTLVKHFNSKTFILHNNFQKFGSQQSLIQGGLDGFNMRTRWYSIGIYSDIETIRNYAGQQIAYQVMFQKYVLSLLLFITIPSLIIYAFQLAYGSTIFPITSQFQIVLVGIGFQIFIYYWTSAQTSFFNDFLEQKPQKIFLSTFTGPYMRNPVTDEVNQFNQDQGVIVWIKNLFSLIFLFITVVIVGAIFHGCKMLLVQIHEKYAEYTYQRLYLSLAHIISYFLFLTIQAFIKHIIISKFLIKKLVQFNNPPSDQMERYLKDKYMFMYVVLVQLIPIFFYFIIYPYTDTYCYHYSCITQLFYYVYTRYLYLILTLLLTILNKVYFYVKKVVKGIVVKNVSKLSFKDKFKHMLQQTIVQQKLADYKGDTLDQLTALFLIFLYLNVISESILIVLISMFIMFGSLRLKILYKARRPLNKSIAITKLTAKLKIIYYIGLAVNCWANVKSYQYLRTQLVFIIELLQTRPVINGVKIQMIQFFVIVINFAIVFIIGRFCKLIGQAVHDDTLQKRKLKKIQNYKFKMYNSKQTTIKQTQIPLRTLFRTFGPKTQNQQLFFDRLQKLDFPMNIAEKIVDNTKLKGNISGNFEESSMRKSDSF